MVPRRPDNPVNRDVLDRKLESLARCVERIEVKTPESAEILRSDHDLQDIISVNLERAVQLSVDLASIILSHVGITAPATAAEAFLALATANLADPALSERLAKAVGFRNIAVHEYDKLDWDIVYSLVTKRVGDFRAFSRLVLEFIDEG